MFENKELRRIFKPKKEEAAGRRRQLHNDGLHDFCPSPVFGG
jgi:hypothetical protein